MKPRIPDLDQLALGVLCLLDPAHPGYLPGRIHFASRGLKLADESTWRAWRRFRWVELWQAVALQLHLNPDTVAWQSLGLRSAPGASVGQLFGERIRVAIQHAVHESLPTIEVTEELRRIKVRPWDFSTWCDDIGAPCPAEFPRTDPRVGGPAVPGGGPMPKRRAPQVSSEFIRQADLIPALVPFSPATLWRKVKSGEFPAPQKLSTSITAWRRSDIEAWLKEKGASTAKRRTNKGRPPTA